ncbi:MAG: BamA/TamA family outer membrane protein [Chlamydiia bacterium]|nr:BamA/TamA family outer membrane protein [Chlamydiia bacterium]
MNHVIRKIFFSFSIVNIIFSYSSVKDFKDYSVEIAGVSNIYTLQIMKGYSLLMMNYRDSEAFSFNSIASLAKRDTETLTMLLKSLGYLDAKVSSSIDIMSHYPKVFLYSWEGSPYTIDTIYVQNNNYTEQWKRINTLIENLKNSSILLDPDPLASTANITNIQSSLLDSIHNSGMPFASVSSIVITPDKKTKKAFLAIDIKSGPMSTFGETIIEGNQTVNTQFIKDRILWDKGETINKSLISKTRSEIIKSELFKTVTIEMPSICTNMPECSNIAVTIKLSESNHRSLHLRGYIDSNKIFMILLKVAHKNFDGSGGILSAQSLVGKYKSKTFLEFDKQLRYPNQQKIKIIAVGGFDSTQTIYIDSYNTLYTTRHLQFSTEILNHSAPNFKYNVELSIKKNKLYPASDIKNPSKDIRTTYFTIPSLTLNISLLSSTTNKIKESFFVLNLSSQISSDTKSKTYWSTLYAKAVLHTNTIFSNILFHAEAAFGTFIYSNNKDNIPIFKRYFVGGRKHGKGYTYGSISPFGYLVGANNPKQPIGGTCFISSSFEVWYSYKKNLSFITFMEVVKCYQSSFLYSNKSKEPVFCSYGIGLLYDTGNKIFIRLDICIPETPRKNIDNKVQAHVSVGNYSQTI